MSSPARDLSNAANAQQSTGPRTEEGKAQSSQNARTHGLTAQHLCITPAQREEFDQLLAQYQTEVRPQGAIQQSLFDELVAAAWNLRRLLRLEGLLNASAPSDLEFLADDVIQAKLDRLARHKVRIERTFHQSLRELQALQTNAALALTLPRFFTELAPPLASCAQISKRTQTLSPGENNPLQEEFHALRDATRSLRKPKERVNQDPPPQPAQPPADPSAK